MKWSRENSKWTVNDEGATYPPWKSCSAASMWLRSRFETPTSWIIMRTIMDVFAKRSKKSQAICGFGSSSLLSIQFTFYRRIDWSIANMFQVLLDFALNIPNSVDTCQLAVFATVLKVMSSWMTYLKWCLSGILQFWRKWLFHTLCIAPC